MTKMIIVMRTDLNMRKGKMIAQACHGAVNVVLNTLEGDNIFNQVKAIKYCDAWLESDYKKIVVGVNS